MLSVSRPSTTVVLAAVIGLFLLGTSTAAAQPSTVTLDLSGGDFALSVLPGKVTVILINAIPDKRYDRTVNLETTAIPAFPSIALGPKAGREQSLRAEKACEAWNSWESSLATKDEAGVRAALAAKPAPGDCPADVVQAVIDRATASTTLVLSDLPPLLGGQRLTVTIRREAGPGESKSWKLTLTTPQGQWLVSYGLMFTPNRDERYYSKAGDTAGEFTVTKEAELTGWGRDWKLLPSVFFTWLSGERAAHAWGFGPAAGLGASSDSVAVFGGVAVTYRWNLAFVGGLVVTSFTRLSGQYKEGDKVASNLTPEQLQRNVFLPGVFAGITFRFAANPFGKEAGKGDGEQTPTAQKPEPKKKP